MICPIMNIGNLNSDLLKEKHEDGSTSINLINCERDNCAFYNSGDGGKVCLIAEFLRVVSWNMSFRG